MRKRRIWLPWLSLGAVASMAVYAWSSSAEEIGEGPRRTALIQRGLLEETVLATGVIRPEVGAEVNVGSRISGTVVRLPVEVGDEVEVGQILAELDRSALEAAADEVRAEVALAESRLKLTESTLERRRALAAEGLASGEVLDTATQDLAVASARLQAGQARLRSAEINLGYARITAPIRGVVAAVTTREGETVAADFSAPTFVTIVDLDRLEVLAYVDETDIGRVYVGQPASFSVDTYPGQDFAGTVIAIQPRAEFQGSVVNYIVRIEFEPVSGFILRPEMTAHVRLVVDRREDVLTAPRGALKRRDGRQYLLVARADDWSEQEVRTGWRSDTRVEILDGVDEGDRVAINPN